MKEHLSFSGWNQYQECEGKALASDKGLYSFEPTESMLVSKYTEICLIGDAEEKEKFFTENPIAVNSRTGKPKAAFLKAEEAAEKAKEDEIFMVFLEGETQVRLDGVIEGMPIKGFADVISEAFITDFKNMANLNRAWDPVKRRKVSFVEQRNYATQGAIYRELVRQMTGKVLKFYIPVLTKEEIPSKVVVSFKDETLDLRLEMFKDSIPRIKALRAGEVEPNHCGTCDYCKSVLPTRIIDQAQVGLTAAELEDWRRYLESKEDEEV